jgi:hypothetical protein
VAGATAVTYTEEDWVEPNPSHRTGWLAFAAVVLILSGGFKILDALWAFKYDDDISEGVQTVLFEGDLAAWGWLWLVVGILLIAAGIAIVGGAQWARWVGIAVASLSMLTFFPWIYYQPLWTILSITLAMLVLYALAFYGGRDDRTWSDDV